MWNKILGFNSFVVIPLAFIFLIYTAMQAVFFWVWKPFWIAVILLAITLVAEVVLAILND